MIGRTIALATILALTGIALDGTDAAFVDVPIIEDVQAGDTCDGYPAVVGKVLDECPHGPVP